MTSAQLIAAYRLERHPEGGWYREVHRSEHSLGILAGYPGERVALTAIYFLLEGGEFSAFHRVRGEEAWIHLGGGLLELVMLGDEPRLTLLGPVGGGGDALAVVPAGVYQAARPLSGFSLVACLVAPGFDFADFEMPSADELCQAFPHHGELVRRFTRR
jgi:predicted cupin superfamily sugar epimerase